MTRTIDADRLLRWLQDQEDEILEANTGMAADRTAARTIREIRTKVEAMARPVRVQATFRAGVIAAGAAEAPFLAVSTLIRKAILDQTPEDA